MTDYIEVDGLVIDEDGVIVEGGPDALTMVAVRRHDAYVQEKAWERQRQVLDQVLLKGQPTRTETYGDVVVRVGSGTYDKTDAEAFASAVADLPLEAGDLLSIIAAAKGFKRDLLPEGAKEAFDSATETLQKKSWIESSVVRKRLE